jgi:uncharacterized protein (DUF305 family)
VPYLRFATMIAVYTIAMFGLMYLNTYTADHAFFSQTRAWMALYMGAVMALIMLGFMLDMYKSRRLNIAIAVTSVAVFAGALFLVRSQATVGDTAWMRAMIPHHSIAIMISRGAEIRDPRVRQLADEIIEAQVRAIAQMRQLIDEFERQPTPSEAPYIPPGR